MITREDFELVRYEDYETQVDTERLIDRLLKERDAYREAAIALIPYIAARVDVTEDTIDTTAARIMKEKGGV